MMARRLGICVRATLLAGVTVPSAAFAQTSVPATSAEQSAVATPVTQAPDTAGDIIVTANRRSERLQDVPLSVTAIEGETLRERGVANPEDLGRLSPSLVTQNNASNPQGTNLSIRGVGTSAFQRSIEPSVAVVLDDVPFVRSELAVINFVDLAQVEVLNGPQGFLFGKNASAGVVNIRTNAPQLGVNSGRVFSEYGRLNSVNDTSLFRIQGIANVALGDNVAARVNLFHVGNTSLQDNVVANPAFDGGLRQNGGSARLLWQPDARFSLLLSGDFLQSDGAGPGVASIRNVSAASPLGGVLASVGVTPSIDNSRSAYDAQTYYHLQVGGGSIRASYELGNGLTLTNIAAYRAFNARQRFDADYSPLPLVQAFGGTLRMRQFTDELRLTSPTTGAFNYQVGLFFLNAHIRENDILAANLGQTPPPGFGTILGADNVLEQGLGSYAAYGQGTYKFTNALSFTLGARLTHDTITNSFVTTAGAGVAALVPVAGPASDSRRETNLSGRATLQYDISRDWMVYGTAARGYKGPGYAQFSLNYVRPEISTHFELGSKSQFFDRRLTVNVALFNTEFRDFQAQSVDFRTFSFLVQNAGKLRTRGAELQVIARPTPRLTFTGGLSYTDARFITFRGDVCYTGQPDCVNGVTDSSGRRLPNAPEWKGVAEVNYQQPLTRGLAAIFNVGVTSQTEYNFLSNGDPNAIQRGFTALDLGLGLTGTSNRWSIRVFCRNCTDSRFVATVQEHPLFAGDHIENLSYNGFRQLGLALDLSF